MDLKKQFDDKIKFLRTTYEVAYNHLPSSPLSVNINPVESVPMFGGETNPEQAKKANIQRASDKILQGVEDLTE